MNADQILLARLKPVLDRLHRQRIYKGFILGYGAAAAITAVLLPVSRGLLEGHAEAYAKWSPWYLPAGLLLGTLGGVVGILRKPGTKDLTAKIEKLYPGLEGRLTTAMEVKPGPDGTYNFLQDHLFTETLGHSTRNDWRKVVKDSTLRWMGAGQMAAMGAFLVLCYLLPDAPAGGVSPVVAGTDQEANGVSVTPGDVELEKGSSLVLLARFTGTIPASAELVTAPGTLTEKRVPLTRGMRDPVFGGTVPDVKEGFSYQIAWDGGKSPGYQVKVFEYPRLERSDVTLTYPDYTKQPVKRIEDMRHTSAVEGTRIDLDLALNKPVASAVLEPRRAKGESGEDAPPALKLTTFPDSPRAELRGFVPEKSGRYELVLTDTEGRRIRQPVAYSFDVLPNKIPQLKLASPKGDQKPSALQELLFTGTVWDDFGVVAAGLEVTTPGGDTVTLDLGKDVPGRETKAFQQLLRLEELSAVPDQLFTWHVWADDIGPDGKVRRTRGDLFYGEIRPFEEVFRQGQGMESAEQQSREQQQQQGEQQGQGAAAKLAELQKQIINAAWKLQRSLSAPSGLKQLTDDLKTVRDSQQDALTQTEEAAGEATDPQSAAHWQNAMKEMREAAERLEKATESPAEVATAVPPAQSAYQTLLKLRAREYEVTRSNRQQQQQQQGQGAGQGGNGGTERQQEQLNQMDLAKKEDRYETQREAQAQQSTERREQMQIVNRLKELAARQQDVNEKLKELQTALNEAKTDQEKEEARRQLKRLEEEQRRMLADADELSQKMEQRQNQAEAGEQRQKLDEARQNMEQAAEATSKGEAGQALASGTRAKEQMQEMKEDLRKQSAGAFSDELRDMRAEARDIARKQEEIARQMKSGTPSPADPAAPKPARAAEAPSLDGPDEAGLAKELDQQRERTDDLVKRATALSEQAEPSEPLLSRQIYEIARQFALDDAGTVKQTQQEMLREGNLTNSQFDEMRRLQESEESGKALRLSAQLMRRNQTEEAARAGERAKEGLDRLRQGVEKAAESVIGDDTEAIRLAESQLDAAAEAVRREIARQQGGEGQPGTEPGEPQTSAPNQSRKGEPGQEGGQRGEGAGETAQNQEPPKEGQPGQGGEGQPGQGRPQTPGQGQDVARSQQGQPREGQPGQNQGQQPGQGREGTSGENQDTAQQQGQPRQGQPGQGQQPGEGQGQQPGQEQGRQQGGQGQGQNMAEGRGERRPQDEGSNNGGGGDGGARQGLETARSRVGNRGGSGAPLTGDGFVEWSDSLREAEEMVDQPELRDGIASARERARQMRSEMKKDLKKPDWAVVQLEVLKPLVEVRQRLREELARRESDKSLVPVDRDPVPAQFSENVRRYYEQLGKDQ